MKNILFISFLSLLVSNITNAQVGSGYGDQFAANNVMITSSTTAKKNINIAGSPYINEKYLPISLTSHEDRSLQARYNGFNGDMEVLDVNKGTVFVLNKNLDSYDVTFTSLDKTYKIFKYIDKDGYISNDFFVKVATSNSINLLKKENVQYLGEKVATSTYDKAREARYKRANDDYYIKISNEEDQNAILLPRNKKGLANLFPEHSANILKHIKSNKIKTSREDDLIKLIEYISTL